MQNHENAEQIKRKELLKQAYLKIQELERRLAEKSRAGYGEPIAIIGMGCRFPGNAYDLESFWNVLKSGTDTVSEVPSDRWDVNAYYDPSPGEVGKMYARHGAFISGIDQFDPQFFGISPREAEKMDPQQRLLLEVVWEALEACGQTSEALQGSNTGVFVALNGDDYAHLMSRTAGTQAIDLYFGTGVARSIAAGRISYTLGLKGPCISLDTACSGSLAAVHLACQSLRMQECGMAVAGGVTLIITPDGHLIGSRGQMLSPDGKCKTFDASADGYVRGEGCGIVVLKRLSDALEDKDTILAVIRGTALNQDGRSSGMTAPNGLAQEEVIRKALADAGLEANSIDYVETHGTGTILGDPIEVLALGNTYGASRPKTAPLIIGAVKTNIGHLEAAAGIAGLIKTVLILQHGEIPPNLHFSKPNPHIPWDKLSIRVAGHSQAWPGKGKRLAAVSSFGFSGTNAHLIIESAQAQPMKIAGCERPLHILALSAKSDAALDRLAECYAAYFETHRDLPAADFCYTANTGRQHHGYRLACIGSNVKELGLALSERSAVKGALNTQALPIAFVFGGRVSSLVNFGRDLFGTQPLFRRMLQRCSQILDPWLPLPLTDLLYPQAGRGDQVGVLLGQAACYWPAAFSTAYALQTMLQSWGIQPAVVMGEGPGEYVAACVAGVLSLEEGLFLAVESGKLLASQASVNDLRQAVRQVKFKAPRLDVVSPGTGDLVDDRQLLDPEYWHRSSPPLNGLQQGFRFLDREGYRLIVQIGADASGAAPQDGAQRECFQGGEEVGWSRLLESVGRLYANGARVDWRGFDQDYGRARVPLPTYPFQRKRYWVHGLEPKGTGAGSPPIDAEALPTDGWGDPSQWYYGVKWRPVEDVDLGGARDIQGLWLLLADRLGVAAHLGARLETQGARCMHAFVGSTFRKVAENRWELAGDRPEEFQQLLQEVQTSARMPLRGVIHCWGMDFDAVGGGQEQLMVCGSLLHMIKVLAASGQKSATRFWIVTRGAQAVDAEKDHLALAQATMWGMGRVVALEQSHLWGGMIDLDPGVSGVGQADVLARAITADSKEDQLAVRRSRLFAARLDKLPLSPRPRKAPVIHQEATYLITGGLGGLGFSVASWMVDQGARYLVLTGRSAPKASVAEVIDQWRQTGLLVEVARADVAEWAQVEGGIETVMAEMPPLKGIVHAAGVIDDGVLLNQDWQRFAKVLAPKVQGAWHMHRLGRKHALDFFVLFSSVAALLGSSGQANYAAGNAFLDLLAHHRRGSGLPAVSINWGPWSHVGMAAALQRKETERREAFGIGSIAPNQGLLALDEILRSDAVQIGVLPADWRRLVKQYAAGQEPSILREILPRQNETPEPAADEGGLLDLLRNTASRREREELLHKHIRQQVHRLLNLNSDQALGLHQAFSEVGMDSLMAVELNQRLQADLKRPLPSTLAFEYPTIDHLTHFILDEIVSIDDVAPANMQQDSPSEERPLAAALEQLSEEEAELELLKTLERKGY